VVSVSSSSKLVQLCCTTGGKAELLSDELGYLAEDTSKQKVKGVAQFLLGVYRKMRG